MFYTDFIPENIAPLNANHVGVYDNESGNKVGVVKLNKLKTSVRGSFIRFGVIADININQQDAPALLENLNNAKQYFKGYDTKFISVCGDVPNIPIKIENEIPIFSINTKTYDNLIETEYNIKYSNTSSYNYYFEFANCVFIFFSNISNNVGKYNTGDIKWLHKILDKYRNKRSFVFIGPPFFNKAGNLYPRYSKLYGVDKLLHFENDFNSYFSLKQLNNYYTNSIWFSGNTRYLLEAQQYSKFENITFMDSTDNVFSAYNIHVPPIINGKKLWLDENDTLNVTIDKNCSQGYLIDIYKKYLILQGVNFRNGEEFVNELVPLAIYKLDTEIKNIDSNISLL